MVASCYRRTGDYTAALEKYKWIHQHFPDDTDCKIETLTLDKLSKLILEEKLHQYQIIGRCIEIS